MNPKRKNNGQLTFEWCEEHERLDIHVDAAGLQRLISYLEKFRDCRENEHSHFMTEEWGSSELSGEPFNSDCRLIHHVKFMFWHDNEK